MNTYKHSSRLEDLVNSVIQRTKDGLSTGAIVQEIVDIAMRLEETSTLARDEKNRPVYGKIQWDVNAY